MQRIKKGDTILVIAGKDLGEQGEVLNVYPKEDRVVVQGINVLKRHRKARQAGTRQIPAQIVEFEGKIHLSNVQLVCPSCGKATRVGFRVREDGFKTRVCKKCNADIDKK
ncbi:50S ribosomal protein L24 [Anaerolineae bacterium CFX9]|jgi:large subunit ribosomal protein L24|nr:50S ribosomal protein L24 [Anaerolineae bacterium CFX9]